MCGIAGFQGRFSPGTLARMGAAVAHRGPDDAGSVILGGSEVPTGLAHRRLAVIDLSPSGHQPLTVDCDRCGSHDLADLALIYNGELYNFVELREQLTARGHRFHSRTDTEVLLHLWADYGPGMLPLLNGIFAFALRDGRSTGRAEGIERGDVILARDQLGVKPLYVGQHDRGLLFASELKALLAEPQLPRDIDPIAVHETLTYLWTPAPRTLLSAVRKVPPGWALIARGGRITREWQYYRLPYGKPRLTGDMRALAEELRTRLQAAVSRQMVADVPTGAFLSGGLDSSTIVALMRRARPHEQPQCFCIGFHGEQIDGAVSDLSYARRVAQHLGVPLEELYVGADIIHGLGRMLYHLDEPQADPAALHVLHISERARDAGIKVLLSGAGGDDIFSGYRRHQALRMSRYWNRMPLASRRMIAGWARHVESAGAAVSVGGAARRRLIKLLAQIDRSDDDRAIASFWWSGDALRRSLLSADMRDRIAGSDPAAPLRATLEEAAAETDPLNRLLYLEARHFLADHNLNYTDKMGMAAGVEIRVPLLDLELVDFAARVPSDFKQRGIQGKAILREAMRPLLPREVVHRPKTGFGAPLRRWVRHELRPLVDDALAPSTLRARGLFDPAGVQRLVQLDRQGRIDGAYTIFALLCIELWCQLFVDGTARELNSARVPGVQLA